MKPSLAPSTSSVWSHLLRWFPKHRGSTIHLAPMPLTAHEHGWETGYGYVATPPAEPTDAAEYARSIRRQVELLHRLYRVSAPAWREFVRFHLDVEVAETAALVPVLCVEMTKEKQKEKEKEQEQDARTWRRAVVEGLMKEAADEEEDEYARDREKLEEMLPEETRVQVRPIEVRFRWADEAMKEDEKEKTDGDASAATTEEGAREAEPIDEEMEPESEEVKSKTGTLVEALEEVVEHVLPKQGRPSWMGAVSLDLDYRVCQQESFTALSRLAELVKASEGEHMRLHKIHLLLDEPKESQGSGRENELLEFAGWVETVVARTRHVEVTVAPGAADQFRVLCEIVRRSKCTTALTINVEDSDEMNSISVTNMWEPILHLLHTPESVRAIVIRGLPINQEAIDSFKRFASDVSSSITSLQLNMPEKTKNDCDVASLLGCIHMPELQLLHITGATISSVCIDHILQAYPRLRSLQLDEVDSGVLPNLADSRVCQAKLTRLRLRIGRSNDPDQNSNFHAFLGALTEDPPCHFAHLSHLTLDQDGHDKALTMRDMTPLFLFVTRNQSLQHVSIHVHDRAESALKMLARVVQDKKYASSELSLSHRLAVLSALSSRTDLALLDQDSITRAMAFAGCYVKRTVETS